jgi:hypothetical protein
VSRFADATKVKVVSLGACQCPGTPHSADEVVVRTELGYEARGLVGIAGWVDSGGVMFSPAASELRLVQLGVVEWNLFGNDGKPMRPTPQSIALLDEETIHALAAALDGAIATPPLPNDSGAPSADGSPESASPTPEIQTPPSSTTS